MNNEQYYYGQGKLLVAKITDNVTGAFRWIGNVTALSGAFTEQSVTVREAYTGNRSKVREFGIEKDLTFTATLSSLIPENIALFTDGTITAAAAGTVTGEQLPAGLTQPLKAAYSYAAQQGVSFLSNTRQTMALRYEGINLAEDGKPVMLELYKLSPGLLASLALIADGTDVAGMEVTFNSLIDTRKASTGSLGQYGRIIMLDD